MFICARIIRRKTVILLAAWPRKQSVSCKYMEFFSYYSWAIYFIHRVDVSKVVSIQILLKKVSTFLLNTLFNQNMVQLEYFSFVHTKHVKTKIFFKQDMLQLKHFSNKTCYSWNTFQTKHVSTNILQKRLTQILFNDDMFQGKQELQLILQRLLQTSVLLLQLLLFSWSLSQPYTALEIRN